MENRHGEIKARALGVKNDRATSEPTPSAPSPASVLPFTVYTVGEAPVEGGGEGTNDPQRLSKDLK